VSLRWTASGHAVTVIRSFTCRRVQYRRPSYRTSPCKPSSRRDTAAILGVPTSHGHVCMANVSRTAFRRHCWASQWRSAPPPRTQSRCFIFPVTANYDDCHNHNCATFLTRYCSAYTEICHLERLYRIPKFLTSWKTLLVNCCLMTDVCYIY